MKPAKHNYTILKQICKLIPAHLVPKLARSFGIDKIARSFSPWSHVVAMLHVQIAHSLSLNDVADTLRNHSGALTTIRGATPPSRNGLSHANRVRDPNMAQALFWDVLSHIESKHPNFGRNHKYSGLPRRFKRTIYAIDSTTRNCQESFAHLVIVLSMAMVYSLSSTPWGGKFYRSIRPHLPAQLIVLVLILSADPYSYIA
jgi:hypothetical protein